MSKNLHEAHFVEEILDGDEDDEEAVFERDFDLKIEESEDESEEELLRRIGGISELKWREEI